MKQYLFSLLLLTVLTYATPSLAAALRDQVKENKDVDGRLSRETTTYRDDQKIKVREEAFDIEGKRRMAIETLYFKNRKIFFVVVGNNLHNEHCSANPDITIGFVGHADGEIVRTIILMDIQKKLVDIFTQSKDGLLTAVTDESLENARKATEVADSVFKDLFEDSPQNK